MTDNLLSQNDDLVQIDESKDYLAELVGDDKKFKDTKALAKGKAFSDAHIAILERRFDALSADYLKLKEQADAGAKLQDLLDKLETQQISSRESNPNSNEVQQKPVGLDEIESLVSSKIEQRERSAREQANYDTVQAKLLERLGSNYKGVLKKQATDLNMSDEEVNQLARRNPTLFFKTFDLNATQTESFQSPTRTSNTFSPKPTEKRTWSYYLKMKEKDPRAWLDRKIAIQMEKDAQALGRDFFDV